MRWPDAQGWHAQLMPAVGCADGAACRQPLMPARPRPRPHQPPQTRRACSTTASCGTSPAPATPLTSTGTTTSTRWPARPGTSGALLPAWGTQGAASLSRACDVCRCTTFHTVPLAPPAHSDRALPPRRFPALVPAPCALPARSTDPERSRTGLFAHPPRPSSFNTSGLALFRDLLAVEVRPPAIFVSCSCGCRNGVVPAMEG